MRQIGASGGLVRRLNVAAVAMVLVIVIAGIVALALDVRGRMAALAEASSDSVQWVLAQLEVDLLRLRLQMAAPGEDTAAFRDRFDILYSRVDTLRQSPHFAGLRAQPDFAQPMADLADFLQRAVPLVDGSDPALVAALPGMAAELGALAPGARQMVLEGVAYFAEASDARRTEVAATLRGLALMVTALVAALLLLLAMLSRRNALVRRQAEENRRTGARLETMVTASADAIVVADRDGRALEFNPAAEAMFGFSRSELLMRDVMVPLVPSETRAAVTQLIEAQIDPARRVAEGGGRIEVELCRRDGSRFPAEISVSAADSGDGEIIVAFVRDISDRRQAERDLIEARDRARAGERAKAEFLTVMSHEMRTPLNGLIGATEILAATPLDPRQGDLIEVISTSADLLLHHMNDVLDLSRAEAGAAAMPETAFDLEALVAEVIANQRGLAEAAGTRLRMDSIGAPVGRVRGRPAQLRRILLNLVGNAVKFTRDGRVTVQIEPLPAPEAGGSRVEFRVIDSGVGIPAEDHDRVFEDFQQLDTSFGRETGGTGLGLGITRRLVLALGGEIAVESRPGAGSCFRVRLPFGPTAAPAAPVAGPAAAAAPMTVLVVDDNPINRFVLRQQLLESGHRVTEAADGAEGVSAAGRTRFDLILLDISMPGLDGIEAARRIRSGPGPSRAARIVAVTAHAQPGEQERFRAAGMEGCLVKPVTRAMLAALLTGTPAEPAPAPAAAAAAPEVDPAILADLVDRLGAEPARLLIRRFLDEGDATIARLAVGLPPDEAGALCHRFAGSAATFGAVALARRLSVAETALALGAAPPDEIAALARAWAASRARISADLPAAPRQDSRAAG